MSENVDSLVLEQLRLIREDLKRMDGRMSDIEGRMTAGFGDVKSELLGQRTMIFSLAQTIGQIDQRVEHIEAKLGIAE